MADNSTVQRAQTSGLKAEGASKGLDAARTYLGSGYDVTRRYATNGYQAALEYAQKGYQASVAYAKSAVDVAGRLSKNLNELARKQPVVAMAAVVAAGYAATRVARTISSRRLPAKKGWLANWRR
jgi:hypothetical protein